MRHLLFLMFFISTSVVYGQQSGIFQSLKLLPTSLPSFCAFGDIRTNTSTKRLNYCSASNTWSEIGSVLTSPLSIANGGTGQVTASAAFNALSPMTTLGDLIYENATPNPVRLAGNITATKNFLVQTGTGAVSAAPVWGTIATGDVPTLNQNTSGTAANITASSNTSLTTLSNLVSVGTITTGTWSGTTVAVNKGGTGVTSVTTAPVATSWVGWDANKNISATGFIPGFTTTATAAGTTTMTIASTAVQYWTGSTTQTVKLPTTSVVAGQQYLIQNRSSGVVTVQSSGANTIQAMAATTQLLVTALVATPTTAANWDAVYFTGAAASFPTAIIAKATGNPGSTTAGNPLIYPTVIYDTNSAYSNITGKFTCPSAGYYSVTGALLGSLAFGLYVYKNGSLDSAVGYAPAATGSSGFAGTVLCATNDTVDVRPDSTTGSAAASSAINFSKIGN